MRSRWVVALAWLFVGGLALGVLPVRRAVSVAHAQWVTVSKQKFCSRCKREVPLSSRPGMRCPHCGAYWSYETTRRRYIREPGEAPAPAASRPSGPNVTIRHGDETFQVPAMTVGGTLLVPLRTFEKFGAVVEKTTDGIVIGLNETVLRLWPGNSNYEVCEGEVPGTVLPVAPRIVRGSLYVPLRAMAEALGLCVDWQDGTLVVE